MKCIIVELKLDIFHFYHKMLGITPNIANESWIGKYAICNANLKHIVSAKIISKERKGKLSIWHVEECQTSLYDQSVLCVQAIWRTVMPYRQTVGWQSVWSLYLPLGPRAYGLRDLFWLIIKIHPGEEVYSQALGSRSLKLQA